MLEALLILSNNVPKGNLKAPPLFPNVEAHSDQADSFFFLRAEKEEQL